MYIKLDKHILYYYIILLLYYIVHTIYILHIRTVHRGLYVGELEPSFLSTAISHLHHKEGLLIKEECVSINETLENWCKVVVHKRSEEAVRIVDILEGHGLDDEAQRI